MKFSIIVPVYNVEKYIERCLKSIQDQSHKNFEVIVVNDGSPDNSKEIIDKFCSNDDRFIYVEKENGGLSDARNFGIKYISGNYIVFIDGDDFVNEDFLKNINKVVVEEPGLELVRYGVQATDENGRILHGYHNEVFDALEMEHAITRILKCDLVEPAWQYVYEKSFYLQNDFLYAKGRLHEDFGLTPYILSKAKRIASIEYVAINYVQRAGSIMQQISDEKKIKSFNDMIFHYQNLTHQIQRDEQVHLKTKKLLLSFIANGLLERYLTLGKQDRKNYKKQTKNLSIAQYLVDDTIMRRIKKLYYSLVL